MCPKKICLPAYEWYGDIYVEHEFPDAWTLNVQHMAGYNAKLLSKIEMMEKLQHPIGSQTLRDLARGKRKCVIIFDDMTRPTKVWQMLPVVFDELYKGGLTDDKVVFVKATGAHGARMFPDFVKKLGEDVAERFLVFNHNPYENLINLGETSFGTPVQVNREVMQCDLKVVIGALMPHFGYGFGGGAKMLLPGIAGIDSIRRNHIIKDGVGPGKILENLRRRDSEEAAQIAGIDFMVDALLNPHRDVADIVCGDIVKAHRKGVELARKHYVTPVIKDADMSIGNGYPMASEGYKAYAIAEESVRNGGDLVFLLYAQEGCRVHYYNGRFGTDYGGLGWKPDKYIKKPWKMARVIAISPQKFKADELYYGEGSIWFKSWTDALRSFQKTHGSDIKVAIYPYASMQISKQNAAAK